MKTKIHLIAIAAIAGAMAAGAVQTLISARADQFEIIPPTAGIYTGPQFSQLLGNANRSIASCNKGPSAPAVVAGAAIDGLCWIDDHASPWLKKRYVDGNWVVEGAYDPVNAVYVGAVGGGTASIASASTVDLGSVPQSNITITGTTAVANFGASATIGAVKFLDFDGVLTLTHSGNLLVPGGFPVKTAAGDAASAQHLGLGVWRITQYTRASGVPIDIAAVGQPRYSFSATVPDLHLRGDGSPISRALYPVFVAKVTRAQNGTRTSGNATITGIANTSAFGPGMPIESTGVNAGCTIASFVANTSITLNSSSCVTASGTSSVTVFLTGYGAGGDATTVGVPNCSGSTLAGRETSPSRLSQAYFGANSSVMAIFGGNESKTLSVTQLPSITSANPTQAISVTTTVGGIPWGMSTAGTIDAFGGVSNGVYFQGGANVNSITSAGNNSISVTSTGTNNSPISVIGPMTIADCIVRVTP